MKKYLIGTVLSLLLILALSAGYFSSLAPIQAQGRNGDKQATCSDSDGWTKIESSEFYPVTGAVEYCFKAGPYITNEMPEGGFGQSGGCSQDNIQNCGLSHWSYKIMACPLPYDGDHAHYDYGWHQIVGDGLLEGSDDVYSLNNTDYLQCFCGLDGQGIQTYWWRTDLQSLAGWYSLNGLQWNLGNYHYLAQNTFYDCSE